MKRDILHVMSGLGYGGIETWLTTVFRHSNDIRDRSQILLVGNQMPSSKLNYTNEIASMGIPIDYLPLRSNSLRGALRFVQEMRRWLSDHDVKIVHSHLNYLSGLVTLAASLAGIRESLAHYHVSFPIGHKTPAKRGAILLIRLCEAVTARRVIGCSTTALNDYTMINPRQRRSIVHYTVDSTAFMQFTDAETLASCRAEFGIPEDAFVIGHVGRFDPQKNHEFLIEIFRRVHQVDHSVFCLLIGDGPLRPAIKKQVECLDLSNNVIFAGLRSDVPLLMLGAMDCFIFPSLYEGLGIVLVEAQAAGLPCIVTNTLPEEAKIIPQLVHGLSLDQSASAWAEVVLAFKTQRPMVSQTEALHQIQQSHFSIERSVQDLMAIYNGS